VTHYTVTAVRFLFYFIFYIFCSFVEIGTHRKCLCRDLRIFFVFLCNILQFVKRYVSLHEIGWVCVLAGKGLLFFFSF
jgi:hypothetical protein